MSALALCLKDIGETVIGSDVEEKFFTEKDLINKDITILKFNKNNINNYKNAIFIISYAYNENNNEEVKEIIENDYKYYYYSDFINTYFTNTKIGVSGTHGKTTTCALLKTMFENDNISYIIGSGDGGGKKNSKYLIFEACEYKQHFLNYNYDYLIINNIDYDHPDYYNNISEVIVAFYNASKKAKNIIINNDDKYCTNIKHENKYTYGINNNSFVTGNILKENKEGFELKVEVENNDYYFTLPFFGKHMLYNFLASFTVFYLTHRKTIKTLESYINSKIKEYKNPKRRIEEIILENKNIIIDDYAHHPNEIIRVYESVKQKYENYNISIVFQPHTYSRTIFLSEEFKKVFEGKSVYIMNTFISREEYDVMKEKLVSEIFRNHKMYNIKEIKKILEKDKQIVLFIGAGSVYKEINKIIKCKL